MPEEATPSLIYNENIAKLEWGQAIKQKLEKNPVEQNPDPEIFRFNLAEKWGEWIFIPAGEFQMGKKGSRQSVP